MAGSPDLSVVSKRPGPGDPVTLEGFPTWLDDQLQKLEVHLASFVTRASLRRYWLGDDGAHGGRGTRRGGLDR